MAEHVLLKVLFKPSFILNSVPEAQPSENRDDFLVIGDLEGVDVLTDGSGEDKLVLGNSNELRTDFLPLQCREIDAVDGYRAG